MHIMKCTVFILAFTFISKVSCEDDLKRSSNKNPEDPKRSSKGLWDNLGKSNAMSGDTNANDAWSKHVAKNGGQFYANSQNDRWSSSLIEARSEDQGSFWPADDMMAESLPVEQQDGTGTGFWPQGRIDLLEHGRKPVENRRIEQEG